MAVEDPGSIEAQRIARARLMFGTEGRCLSCKAQVFGGEGPTPEEHHPRCLEGLLLRVSWRLALEDTEPGCEIVEATLDKCIERAVERVASQEEPNRVFGVDLLLDADRMIPEVQRAFEKLFAEKVQRSRAEAEARLRESEAGARAHCLRTLTDAWARVQRGEWSFADALRVAGELRQMQGEVRYNEAVATLRHQSASAPPPLLGGP